MSDRSDSSGDSTEIQQPSEHTLTQSRHDASFSLALDVGHGVSTASAAAGDVVEIEPGALLLGRYEIKKCLGRGGFGSVYEAYDHSLRRLVAIKKSAHLRSFVAGQVRNEARAIAALNHPNIIQIHDLVEVDDQEYLIVMEHLDGQPLSSQLKQSRMSIAEAVQIGRETAAALQHAHQHQLVHSDLKPSNLFLCRSGAIKLLDFGLAVAYFPETESSPIGGTPGYMSPEQIRGESHMIDGRTDIWAFGVMMYEMLTGTRPFSGSDAKTKNARTLSRIVPPPRQLNPDVDDELQRIVMRCLQPLINDRYQSGRHLLDDLDQWLRTNATGRRAQVLTGAGTESGASSAPATSLRLSKRGLQPFTEDDASVFFALLPGPKDREGVPDSIRFWQRWVESVDPETEYPVGVLYGPSGSGKTSFVRAGLFGKLGPEICRIFVECRPGDLGARLTRIIESQLHQPSGESSLHDLLYRLRSSDSTDQPFQKVLIVLDQFEAWAHSATLDERIELAEALRQCDGVQIRLLVVTRDDFWSGVKELFRWLDVPMQEGRNVASVDLMSPADAEQVLETLGRNMELLPPDGTPLTEDQSQFINQSVQELAIDGSVICVHLVMFAQMVRLENWSPRALRSSGGVSGACSMFLQELFDGANRRSPEYGRVAPAARVILGRLLPADGESSAGVNATRGQLSTAVEQAGCRSLFDDAMNLLCNDLRIVSAVPVEDGLRSDGDNHAEAERITNRYRLSHDFVVDPVSRYLVRSNSASWRGRTGQRLSELSAIWSRRPSAAYLPNFWEYLTLIVGAQFQARGETESRYLRAATKLHAGRISVAVVALIGFFVVSVFAWSQWKANRESRQRGLAVGIDNLLNNSQMPIEDRIERLRPYGSEAYRQVGLLDDAIDERDRLLAQVYLQSTRPSRFEPIAELIDQAPSDLFEQIASVAAATPDAVESLQAVVSRGGDEDLIERATILLAHLGESTEVASRLNSAAATDTSRPLIDESIRWKNSPKAWVDLLAGQTDPRVRYHAALVLGSFPGEELQAHRSDIDLAGLINAADAEVHSAGRYLAKRLGVPQDSIALAPPAGADWMVGPDGLCMVRLDPTEFTYQGAPSRTRSEPKPPTEYALARSIWMATTPVSRRLYQQYVAAEPETDQGEPTQVSLDSFKVPDYLLNDQDQPMLGTSLAQAYSFCNWLSRRDQLTECYRPVQREAIEFEKPTSINGRIPIQWELDASADGYRVPTLPEFHFAAQAGEERPPRSLAIQIASAAGVDGLDSSFAQPQFTLIPNAYGFFLFDSNCTAWICDDQIFASLRVLDTGIRKGMSIVPITPSNAIYLVRNVATADSADQSLEGR